MADSSFPVSTTDADAAKSKAALSSVLWSGLLTALKVVAGLSSNSLGMLSEALHSALDLVAATITFFAVRLAARPADVDHPFGHGKVENLSALAETLLLFLTCGWIIREAVDRLFFSAAAVEPRWWVFGVVIVSLIVDTSRSAMLRKVARKHRSQALEADALHFTTDVWSSAVVLAGLICVAVANKLEPGSTWHLVLSKADAVAALGVAGIVLVVSWQLARRSINSLMDGGNEKEARLVRDALAEMAPVWKIRRVRVRESGAHYFVDVTVAAPPSLRVDDAHDIIDILEEIVSSVLPDAESIIHVEPEDDSYGPRRDFYATARNLAALRGLLIHGLALMTLKDGLHIFVHIELPPDMLLSEAHTKVSAYEDDLAHRVGAVHVVSHLEPLHEQAGIAYTPAELSAVLDVLQRVMKDHPDLYGCYDEDIWNVGARAALSFRCRTSPDATVAEAHLRAARLEADLRQRLPSLEQVTIHVEPDEEPARPHSRT